MSYLKVLETSNSYHRNSSEEEYGWWEEKKDYSVDGVALVDEKSYHDLVTDWTINEGDILYLVVVKYSSGDSFGRSEGNMCYIEVFKTEKLAHKLVKKITDNENGMRRSYSETQYTLQYKSESGKTVPLYTGTWTGYFNGLEDCYVESVIVSGKEE